MRTLGVPILLVATVLIIGACDDVPAVDANLPDLVGVVAEVDSPEKVDGGRLLGAMKLSLADGTVLDVPRGVDYDGPRCMFVEESGDYGSVREVSECLVHVGMVGDAVDWILGFRIEPDGGVTPGFTTGDLVEVNVAEHFVLTRYGHAFPWQDELPVVDCALSGLSDINDPALVDHAVTIYRFDADGYLSGLVCGYEG